MRQRSIPRALALAGVLFTTLAHAQSAAPAQPMFEIVLPTIPPNKPQTEQQAEEGREKGRALPPPEILQPALDTALPPFTPRLDRNLKATYKGSASDVLVVLAKKWIDKFKTYYPNVNLVIDPPYAGSLGAVELVKENRDFVFVSRELRPDDLKDFNAKFMYGPTSIPVSGGSYRHFGALDAVAFFVNKANPIEQITFDQLDAMYSSTRHRGGKAITKWGDLGVTGEFADKPITLVGLRPWNGFEEFVRQRVLSVGDKRGEWRDDIKYEKLVFPVAKDVAADPAAIGYSGMAYIDAPVKLIPVVEKAGGPVLAPTYENVALAAYPLSRLTYFNVNKAPGKPLPPAIDEFMRFVLSKEGQQVVLDQASYVPLRDSQAQASRALLGN
jgi:phosphate transport system substrate-binding protein